MTETLKLKKNSPAPKNKPLKDLLKHSKTNLSEGFRSILIANEKVTIREFQRDEIIKIIKELSKNKTITFKDIPIKIMVILLQFLFLQWYDRINHTPISTLSNFSKKFEKSIYAQANSFIEPKLSKYLASFRKNHNTWHALLKTWRSMLNNGNKAGVIVLAISKAFDTVNHNLHLCKLKAPGFNRNALTFIQSYISYRHQRTKLGD